MKAKLMQSDGQINIDKYRETALRTLKIFLGNLSKI